MNLDQILDEAMKLDASDVHLICDNKPMLRIARKLVPVPNSKILTLDDMNEFYEYLIEKTMSCVHQVDKDEIKIMLSEVYINIYFSIYQCCMKYICVP